MATEAQENCPLAMNAGGAQAAKEKDRAAPAREHSRIKVCVRLRPIDEPGQPRHCAADEADEERRTLVEHGHPSGDLKAYSFDRVFNEASRTDDVYKQTIAELVGPVVAGVHGTALVYGQTSSGKTYTMFGEGSEPGAVQLALRDLFREVEEARGRRDFTVQLSYVEVYNEVIRDLLEDDDRPEPAPRFRTTSRLAALRSPNPLGSSSAGGGGNGAGAGGGPATPLTPGSVGGSSSVSTPGTRSPSVRARPVSIRENQKGGVVLTSHRREVESIDEAMDVLEAGAARRHFSTTGMNERSSRSHTILTVHVSSVCAEEHTRREAQLNLVDLAGSESMRSSQASGSQIAEAKNINRSLLALALVISNLAASAKGSSHVGFRNSKLTRILKPALSGESLVTIICCITPSRRCTEETRSTLQFARTARKIPVNAKVNETVEPEVLVEQLRRELSLLRRASNSTPLSAIRGGDRRRRSLGGADTPLLPEAPAAVKSLQSTVQQQSEKISRLTTLLSAKLGLAGGSAAAPGKLPAGFDSPLLSGTAGTAMDSDNSSDGGGGGDDEELNEREEGLRSLPSSPTAVVSNRAVVELHNELLRAKVSNLEERLEAVESEAEAQAEALKRDGVAALGRLREAEQGKEAALAALSRLEREQSASASAAGAQAAALQGELECAKEKLQAAEGSLAAAEMAVARLEKDRDAAESAGRARGEALELELRAATDRWQAADAARREAAAAAARLEEARDEARRALARLEEDRRAELTRLTEEVSRARADARRAEEAREALEARLENLQNKAEHFEAERELDRERVASLQGALAQGAAKEAELSERKEAIERELVAVKARCEELHAKCRQVEVELVACEVELVQLRAWKVAHARPTGNRVDASMCTEAPLTCDVGLGAMPSAPHQDAAAQATVAWRESATQCEPSATACTGAQTHVAQVLDAAVDPVHDEGFVRDRDYWRSRARGAVFHAAALARAREGQKAVSPGLRIDVGCGASTGRASVTSSPCGSVSSRASFETAASALSTRSVVSFFSAVDGPGAAHGGAGAGCGIGAGISAGAQQHYAALSSPLSYKSCATWASLPDTPPPPSRRSRVGATSVPGSSSPGPKASRPLARWCMQRQLQRGPRSAAAQVPSGPPPPLLRSAPRAAAIRPVMPRWPQERAARR